MRRIIAHRIKRILRIFDYYESDFALGVGDVGVAEGIGDVDCDVVTRLQESEVFRDLGCGVLEVVLVSDFVQCSISKTAR